MAKCTICGKHGFTLKVSMDGRCLSCVTTENKSLKESLEQKNS